MIIYVAKDSSDMITTHDTLDGAKDAIHFREQMDDPITWDPVYTNDNGDEICYYMSEHCIIYVTKLNDKY